MGHVKSYLLNIYLFGNNVENFSAIDDKANFKIIMITIRDYVKSSFLSLTAHGPALISISLALSPTPVFTLRDHGYGASVLRCVSQW